VILRRRLLGVGASLALGFAGGAWAGSGSLSGEPFCDRAPDLSAAAQDRLLRFAAVVRDELSRFAGDGVALISRSGLDVARFGIRLSHAAIAWRDDDGRWIARQLYYACEEGRPRLYDQGLAGFVLGSDDPREGHVSIVVVPAAAAAALREAALDTPRALRLLAGTYSANAFPFSRRYQNCNQWVAELLADAWRPPGPVGDARAAAQAWLRSAGYAPGPIRVAPWQLLASAFVPLVHLGDHPEADRAAGALRFSLPRSIEAFVQRRYPASRRIEICHDGDRVVVRRDGASVGGPCRSDAGDRVVPLGA